MMTGMLTGCGKNIDVAKKTALYKAILLPRPKMEKSPH